MELTAILWDLDGTLIDSEPYWMATEEQLVAEYGGTWTREDAQSCVGQTVPFAAELMIASGVDLTVEELTDELFRRMDRLIRTQGLPYRPGARELLEAAREDGLTQALVTQSYGPYVDAAVAAAPAGAFRTVRTGDQVANPKPAPDLYLAAMDDLGLRPSDCLAIEDSAPGAQAILAAGVTPVVVPHIGELPELPGAIVLDTLTGLTLADLRRLHRDWQNR